MVCFVGWAELEPEILEIVADLLDILRTGRCGRGGFVVILVIIAVFAVRALDTCVHIVYSTTDEGREAFSAGTGSGLA